LGHGFWKTTPSDARTQIPSGGVAFSPDCNALITGGGDQSIRIWKLASGKEIIRIDVGTLRKDWVWETPEHINLALSLAYSGDGKNVASWGIGGKPVLIWSTQTGRLLRELKGNSQALTALAFSPDGKTLATCDQGGEARLWDPINGEIINTPLKSPPGLRGKIYGMLAFSEDSRKLAVSALGVHIIDLANGKEQLLQHSGSCSIVYCRGGRMIAVANTPVGANQSTVRLVDTTTRKEYRTLVWPSKNSGSGSPRISLGISPDGRFLAVGDGRNHVYAAQADWTVTVWDLLVGRKIACLCGHQGPINGVAFSPDGQKLASTSDDGTALVWDLLRLPQDRVAQLRKGLNHAVVEGLWSALGKEDPQQFFPAMAEFALVKDRAIPLFRDRLITVTPDRRKEVIRLIADLDSNEFRTRETASRELEGRGLEVATELHQELAGNRSAETQRRLKELLESCEYGNLSPSVLRQERALTILEWIGSPDAREVLRILGQGDPKAQLTILAGAALRRVNHRLAGATGLITGPGPSKGDILH
jgi:WD40 repeat protein